jgi:plasmid stabilization system protein ParE
LNPFLKERLHLLQEREGLTAELEAHRWQAERREEERTALRAECDSLAAEAGMLRGQAGMLCDEAAHLHREIAMVRQTATWRLRERLLRLTPLIKLYRLLHRSESRERHARTAAGAGDPAPRIPSRETAARLRDRPG